MSKEPALSIGATVSAIVAGVILVLRSFGVAIDAEQEHAIQVLLGAVVALPFVAGFLIRFFVVSPATAAEAVAVAKQQEPTTRTVPKVEVKGYEEKVGEFLGRPKSALEFRPIADGDLG